MVGWLDVKIPSTSCRTPPYPLQRYFTINYINKSSLQSTITIITIIFFAIRATPKISETLTIEFNCSLMGSPKPISHSVDGSFQGPGSAFPYSLGVLCIQPADWERKWRFLRARSGTDMYHLC